MRTLFHSIASALRSWLNSLRGEPGARRCQSGVSRDQCGVSGTAAAILPSAYGQAIENTAATPPETDTPTDCDGIEEGQERFRSVNDPNCQAIIERLGQPDNMRSQDHGIDAVIPHPQSETSRTNTMTSPLPPHSNGDTVDDGALTSSEKGEGKPSGTAAELATRGVSRGTRSAGGTEREPEHSDLADPTGTASNPLGRSVNALDAEADSKSVSDTRSEIGAETVVHYDDDRTEDAPEALKPFAEEFASIDRPSEKSESQARPAISHEVADSELEDSAAASEIVDTAGHSGNLRAPQPILGDADNDDVANNGASGKGDQGEEFAAGNLSGAPDIDAGVWTAKSEPNGSPSPPPSRQQRERRSQQYRAPAGRPPLRQRQSRSQARPTTRSRPPSREMPAPINLRLIFQRGGYCVVSLLPRRLHGLPDKLVVSSDAGDVKLGALQDEWYQDIFPTNLGQLLCTGIVWKDCDTCQEWRLSGREVFVLSHGTTHMGFVSCPRLVLGRDHVVLCTTEKLGPVEDALRRAGCVDWSHLGEDMGAPSGWRVLQRVVPQKAVPLNSDVDILNVLRPLPRVKIALEGGIRLAYNAWLLGYPPTIHVYGLPEHHQSVLIDGQKAVRSESDGYEVSGSGTEGDHQVWCSSTERSYSVVRGETCWTYWPAYSFALGRPESHRFEFCGPLVRPVSTSILADQRRVVQVAPSNCVLLGACPGEVFIARPRADLRGAQCLGLPPFEPVWALPRQPLHCDKRVNRILLVGEPTARPCYAYLESPPSDRRNFELWYRLILDASRKGLSLESALPATHNLWRDYKRLARKLWRNSR